MGFGIGGFDGLFSVFPVLFFIVFVLVIGMFVVSAVRGVSTWNRNNASPQLTVFAEVVTKRTDAGGGGSGKPDLPGDEIPVL